ncbi:MAG: STAS domain-containing protein [Capsulimonadales bacterium]|nr:STAS domain-containing protein [Capsulimonadales bacterium]
MTAQTEVTGDIVVVRLPLEKLDLSTTSDFKQMMLAVTAEYKKAILDLSSISFVDSSGLGALLSVLRELTGVGGDLKLCCVQKRVRVMFELVRMHRVLTIYDTVPQALASFADPASA